MGAPKRIFAWSAYPTSDLVGTWSVTRYPSNAEHYILAAEHDRLMAAARNAALEEAARAAETEGVRPDLNVYAGGPDWYKHGKRIAAAIRAMKGKP